MSCQNNNLVQLQFIQIYFLFWHENTDWIFICRFVQHPKNFGLIASYLERKVNCGLYN